MTSSTELCGGVLDLILKNLRQTGQDTETDDLLKQNQRASLVPVNKNQRSSAPSMRRLQDLEMVEVMKNEEKIQDVALPR